LSCFRDYSDYPDELTQLIAPILENIDFVVVRVADLKKFDDATANFGTGNNFNENLL
jgi:hypothetical protein